MYLLGIKIRPKVPVLFARLHFLPLIFLCLVESGVSCPVKKSKQNYGALAAVIIDLTDALFRS